MKLSTKNAERMNRLLGMTEDDLKAASAQKTIPQSAAPTAPFTQGSLGRGLDPAAVANSIAAEHNRNENVRAQKLAASIFHEHDRSENTRSFGDALSMLRNTRETANRVKDIYNAKMIAAEHDAAEDVRGAYAKREDALTGGGLGDAVRSINTLAVKGIQNNNEADRYNSALVELQKILETGGPVGGMTFREDGTVGQNPSPIKQGSNAVTDVLGLVGRNTMAGVDQLNSFLMKSADFFLPDVITPKPVQNVMDWYKTQADRSEQEMLMENYARGGELGAVAGSVYQGLIPSGAQMIFTLMSGGVNNAGTVLNALKNAGVSQGITSAIGSAMKNPSFWSSFAMTAGNDYEDAKANGASETAAITTAFLSSMLNAGIEIGGGVDDLAKSAGRIGWRDVAKSVLGEGLEEVEQGVTTGVVHKGLYDKDREWFSLDNPDAVINPSRMAAEFAGGTFAGSLLSGGNALINNALNYRPEPAFTPEQRTLLDDIERRLADRQEQRTLGENSRKNYEKAKEEDAGRTPDFDRQFDHYNKMGELGIEFDKIPEIASATPVSDAVKQGAYLTGKNDGVERAAKLADRALAGESLTDAEIDSVLGHKETRQRFENAAGVKFSQSNAENRTTVRNYVEAEQKKPRLVKNDFSKEFGAETEDMLDRLAKRGGAQIEIVESIADGSAGKYLDGKIQISAEKLREDRAGALRSAVMHEMTHHIETSGQYEQLKSGIKSYLESKGVDVEYELEMLAEEYEANGVDLLEDDQIWREYVAKNAESLLSDEESVRYLARENRGLFDKIREFLRDLVTRFKGTQDEREMRKLLAIYDRALDTVGQNEGNRYQGEQHLIKRAQDGTSFVEVEEDVLEGADEKDIPRILSDIIQNKFHNLIEANGQQIGVNARTGKEWRRSKDAARLYSQDRTAYHDKIRSFNNADELLNASRDYIGEGLKHVRKDNFVEFARGTVDFRVQGRGYTADVVVGTTKDGRAYLYDVVNLGQKNIADTSLYRHQQNASNDRGDVSATNSVPQNGASGNGNITQNSGQTSVGRSIDELRTQGEQMTPEERRAYVEASRARRAKLRELAERYGEIPAGERPARELSFPKQTNDDTRVRRFARTAAEASVLTDEQAGAIEQAVLDGVFDYEPIGDQYAVERAEAKILRDTEQAKRDWAAVVNSNDRITKNDIALGELLLKQAAEAGDTQEVIRLTAEIAAAGTRAGQVVQAMRLLKQMGGAGQLAGIDQLTNQYQKDLDKRYGKKAPQLDIPDNLKQDLANAKTEAEIEQAKNAIFKHIAFQIPSTWGDKWNAWRYLAMLGNPRTHIRNVLGNALFEPMIGVKNVLGAVIEAGTDPVVKKVRGKGIERTKTLKPVSRAVKDFAKADYAEMEEIVKHGGKYNDGQKIDEYRTIFTNKAIEWARKANGAALEKEDGIFLGRHYTRALASYITANNLDVAKLGDGSRESAKLLDKARAYAIREAQKATYRDASQTAELIAQTARRGKLPVRMVLEGVLPFKKTPINILKRGLEYSPAGLVKAVYKGVGGLKNGGYTANEFIDDLAAGLSGSALLALGFTMTSLGLLTGGGDDEDESKWYKDMLGYQSYALRAGDTTYTLDWMAPGSMPLFVGVELFNLVNGGTLEASDLLGAMELVTAPMNNMSMLSGLNDTLDNLAYGGDTSNALMNLFTDSVLSYLSQAVPTLGGQIARTADGTRRTTYADPNNAIPDSWEKALQKAGNKIPYLSEKNPAYINLWGETEETENPLYRFVTNALSPGYVDTIKVDALDEELLRLYEATGENVFPDSAGKSIRVGGETIKLTVDEFQTYAATLGKTSHEILYELAESRQYRKADDADKVAAVDMAYQYARALAKTEVSDYELDGWIAKAHDAAAVDLSPDDYILYKLACMRVDADQNDSITQEEAKNAIDSMEGLTKKQRAYLWQSQDKRWSDKKNPYK